MTTRIYYTEPYRRDFDATVVACQALEDGRFEVLLDCTACYPTSGGQPFDTGLIGGARLVDAIDRDDDVVHIVDQALEPGSSVRAAIDWPRRFDHMQQHTGQHVLSAAFERVAAARTESFHLGAATATIDLSRVLSPDDVRAAEDEANRVVWEDRPVTIRFVTAEEAMTLPLRKEPARAGLLRLIEIEDFDLSACGGTHVARTGAIGTIAVSAFEKFRGGTRVEFLCGGRALGRFREWRDALAATTRHLSVPVADLAASVERLQADAKASGRVIRGLQEQLAVHDARAMVERGTPVDGRILVCEALDGWDAAGLKALAAAASAAEPRVVLALFNRARPALAIVARGAEGAIDAAVVLKALVLKFGGKGGGKSDLAQGGGLDAPSDELVAAAKALMTESGH